jgi:uracil-DNA glycosylase family 4
VRSVPRKMESSGSAAAPDAKVSAAAPDAKVSALEPDAKVSALEPARVHPDDLAPPVVDLRAAPEARPADAPLDFTQLPSHHDPLNSIALAERAAIHAAALPILDEVAARTRECRKCGLCETRTKAVPGTGSAKTGIVFVGEAPGADEDAQGEPFVGRAGKLLTEIIKGMDDRQLIPGVSLTRETVYICNVLKCRPPENRNPLPHEIEACSPYLDRQLEALKPRIICCLGKFAAELLVGVKGTIRDMRGKVYRYKGARLIVTYHPAAILRSPNQYRRPVWEDMQLLAREYLASLSAAAPLI